jgi:hypothetical protein
VTDRAAVAAAARELLRLLGDSPGPVAVRVTEADGRLACLVTVWEVGAVMPTAAGQRRRGERAECKRDILAAVREAGRPLTRKQLVRVLRAGGTGHGPGTVAKALADLTAAGELVNRKDKRGYRMPDWPKPPTTRSLFG